MSKSIYAQAVSLLSSNADDQRFIDVDLQRGFKSLTRMEQQVAVLVGRLSYCGVANYLHIKPELVERLVRNIRVKLDADERGLHADWIATLANQYLPRHVLLEV